MITDEKLTELYNGFIAGDELTTKKLHQYGFQAYDISNLIENKTIQRIKRGIYTFSAENNLFDYGKKLRLMGKKKESSNCFKKCYEINPGDINVCLKLFLISIENKEYSKAVTYFDYLYNSTNNIYKKDINYYLYLLNTIAILPEKYQKYAKDIVEEDVKLPNNDGRYNDIIPYNKVRVDSLKQNFGIAYMSFNELIKDHDEMNLSDIITKKLLIQALEVQEKRKHTILNMINKSQYNKVIEYLDSISKRFDLEIVDETIVSLVKELKSIFQTGIIPQMTEGTTDSLFSAIRDKNFELALSLSESFNEKKKMSPETNIIYILLLKIKKNIDQIKNGENHNMEKFDFHPALSLQQIEEKNESNGNSSNMQLEELSSNISNSLMKQDYEQFFTVLTNHLKKTGQTNMVIEELEHIKEFVKTGTIKKEEADGLNIVRVDNLERQQQTSFNIDSYMNELQEKGIIILGLMDSYQRKQIHTLINEIPNVVSFSIGEKGARQIVLRFRPLIEERLNFSKIIQEGNTAYSTENYDLCIQKYRKLLQFGNPKSWVYAKLGFAYMKQFKKKTAIDFLTVATELSKKEKTGLDFTNLINSLKGYVVKSDETVNVRANEIATKNDISESHKIDKLEVALNHLSSGEKEDVICCNFNLNEDEKVKLYLMFAQKCYIQQKDNLGNQYLKKAERMKNKSKDSIRLFQDIEKNKQFFKYRNN